ncbi:Cro/Cl family transcriptional regulator [Desulfovibrio fairfieldensis]|uniref:Cro/Cl family transcriptional regulator n=2 Tax=Desulfovibrio fairfieldensis TaxID=44742 RepID=A0A109W589_9BACT|nr:Cro/Cl family transcriptional regulator [Desulfovibrio fairfieldensis]
MGITYKVELACQNSGLGYWDIIKRIQAVTNTRTQTALAEILEIRQSSISDAKRRQSVPGAWYMTLFEKLGVNPDWLKSGIGPVYLRTEVGYIPGDGDGKPLAPGLLGSPLSQPALVTMYAMRGDDTENGAAVATLRPTGSILLPRAYAREGIVVLAVDNDAAAPTVRRGAYVGIDTRADCPASGELFAITLPHGEIVLRRLLWDEDYFRLCAENPAYPDRRIRLVRTEWILGRLAWVMQEI